MEWRQSIGLIKCMRQTIGALQNATRFYRGPLLNEKKSHTLCRFALIQVVVWLCYFFSFFRFYFFFLSIIFHTTMKRSLKQQWPCVCPHSGERVCSPDTATDNKINKILYQNMENDFILKFTPKISSARIEVIQFRMTQTRRAVEQNCFRHVSSSRRPKFSIQNTNSFTDKNLRE